MAGKLINVGNDDRFHFRVRLAANPLAKFDACTCERPLEWPEHKFPAFRQIKAYPKEAKCFLEHSGNIREVCHKIDLVPDQGFDLRSELVIDRTSVGCP